MTRTKECPMCSGEGIMEYRPLHSPSPYDYDVTCPTCNGEKVVPMEPEDYDDDEDNMPWPT